MHLQLQSSPGGSRLVRAGGEKDDEKRRTRRVVDQAVQKAVEFADDKIDLRSITQLLREASLPRLELTVVASTPPSAATRVCPTFRPASRILGSDPFPLLSASPPLLNRFLLASSTSSGSPNPSSPTRVSPPNRDTRPSPRPTLPPSASPLLLSHLKPRTLPLLHPLVNSVEPSPCPRPRPCPPPSLRRPPARPKPTWDSPPYRPRTRRHPQRRGYSPIGGGSLEGRRRSWLLRSRLPQHHPGGAEGR